MIKQIRAKKSDVATQPIPKNVKLLPRGKRANAHKQETGNTAAATSRNVVKRKATAGKATQKLRDAIPAVRETSKLATVISMMRRTEGATIRQLAKTTDWQEHSVRGAISGTLKKKLGLGVTSTKTDGVRTYRIQG